MSFEGKDGRGGRLFSRRAGVATSFESDESRRFRVRVAAPVGSERKRAEVKTPPQTYTIFVPGAAKGDDESGGRGEGSLKAYEGKIRE